MLITRCPACQTAFRVTPEQLTARVGKVRCGYCNSVFDALETLAGLPRESVASAALPVATGGPAPPNASTGTVASDPPGQASWLAPRLDPEPEPIAAEESGFETDEADAAPESTAAGRLRRVLVWSFAALIAFTLFAGQAVFVFRSELAVRDPAFRPLLEKMCGALACDIPLPRKSELIGIETSDLHPDRQDKTLLVLATTLKNRAPFAQAYPHLELTLTDRDDRPLLRRVLVPADYLSRTDEIQSGIAANAEFAVSLWLDAGDIAAIGYRLYLFYP